MALMRWDPWGDIAALQRDMDTLFGRGAVSPRTRAGNLIPPIDAFRTDEGLIVRVELPGMKPDDVDVSVHDGVLTISGERFYDHDVKDDAWVRRERVVGQFERSFTLPEGTDPDKIQANFEHGVLELTIAHPPERKPRKIAIGGGGESEAVDVG